MTDTNKLLSVPPTDLQGADLFQLFAQKYGQDAALSLANLAAWLNDGQITAGQKTTQYASPSATGFEVAVKGNDHWLILTPEAAYAAGEIELPKGQDRSEVSVVCTQAVTALTVTPATGDTVSGAPTALSANDSFLLRYDGTMSKWYKVG